MTSLKVAIAVCWIFLGVGLVVDGVVEWWSWQGEPVLLASSLRWWHSTTVIPGLFAVIAGILVWREIAFARLAAFLLATVFTLYVIYIVLLTPPDHLMGPMLAVQGLVVGLSALTTFYAVRSSPPRHDLGDEGT